MRMLGIQVACAAALLLAGCGETDEKKSAPAPKEAASSSPSAEAVTPQAAERAALAGLLPDPAMAKTDFAPKRKREGGKWNWYRSCDKQLPSNAMIVGGAQAQWGDGKRTVNQIVDVYSAGGATDAVAEVKQELTCRQYIADGDVDATQVKVVELPAVKGADAQVAWCETIKAVSRCHSAVAVGDSLSYFWALSDPLSDTQDTLGALTLLAGARLVTQGG